MVASFGDKYDAAWPEFRPTVPDPLEAARLGDLLPQVLARYGYSALAIPTASPPTFRRTSEATPETNRPGVVGARRRVG